MRMPWRGVCALSWRQRIAGEPGMDEGRVVERNEPEEFFNNPQSDRTKLFLNQILSH